MKLAPASALALALITAAFGGTAARGQTTSLYTANATTATSEPGTVHFLQVVNLALGPGTYQLDSVAIGLNFTDTTQQNVLFVFYTGVDTNPNSTNVLANATPIGAFKGNDFPPAAGTFSFTYPIPPGFTFTTTGNGSLAVEVTLTTASTGDYSTTQNGRFTASVPTLGTSAGYVWNDADLNNIFTGAEQTTFGMANANTRLALSGVRPAITSFTHQGTVSTVTYNGYTGHNYQLQRNTSLTATWSNVGSAQAGNAGAVLTFTSDDGADGRAFYRIVDTSMSTPSSRPARSKLTRIQQISSIPLLKPSIIRAD